MKIIKNNNMNKKEILNNLKIENDTFISKYSVEMIGKICEKINVEEVNNANLRIRTDLQEEIIEPIKGVE